VKNLANFHHRFKPQTDGREERRRERWARVVGRGALAIGEREERGGERERERERESCVAAKRGRWVRMTETLESQYI
jgi:hypothetical protein